MATHYTVTDIISALRVLGIQAADAVFVHSNIGFLGRLTDAIEPGDYYRLFKKAFFEVLGPEGTLIMPTFSYSFCKKQPFDIRKTPGVCGILSESMRQDLDAKRYGDANFSIIAIGAKAKLLTKDAPSHAFGPNCFWDRFLYAGGKFCNINFDTGSTFIHYVEKQLSVPYRYDKAFPGVYKDESGVESQKEFIHFVYDLDKPEDGPNFVPFDRRAKEEGLAHVVNLGKGQLSTISAADTFSLIQEEIRKNPYFLTYRQSI